jgi:hypothetical protein
MRGEEKKAGEPGKIARGGAGAKESRKLVKAPGRSHNKLKTSLQTNQKQKSIGCAAAGGRPEWSGMPLLAGTATGVQ